jgi:hypothetical protein
MSETDEGGTMVPALFFINQLRAKRACQKFSVTGQSQLFLCTKGNNTNVRSKTETHITI